MLTPNQVVALTWAVTCVVFLYSALRVASLKRKRAAKDFANAQDMEIAADLLNELLNHLAKNALQICRDYNISSPW